MTSWTSVTPHFLSMKVPIVKTGQPSPFDLVCLLGEFARRRDDKRTHLAQRAFGQPLQNGQQEGSGLADAGCATASP